MVVKVVLHLVKSYPGLLAYTKISTPHVHTCRAAYGGNETCPNVLGGVCRVSVVLYHSAYLHCSCRLHVQKCVELRRSPLVFLCPGFCIITVDEHVRDNLNNGVKSEAVLHLLLKRHDGKVVNGLMCWKS